jgi:hypothetical protein
VVQIWPGQTVTCLHTNRPGHIWTTLYIKDSYCSCTATLSGTNTLVTTKSILLTRCCISKQSESSVSMQCLWCPNLQRSKCIIRNWPLMIRPKHHLQMLASDHTLQRHIPQENILGYTAAQTSRFACKYLQYRKHVTRWHATLTATHVARIGHLYGTVFNDGLSHPLQCRDARCACLLLLVYKRSQLKRCVSQGPMFTQIRFCAKNMNLLKGLGTSE